MEEGKAKKNFLYERNIDKVIAHAQCKDVKEDHKTTAYIPIEQEIVLKDLEDEYGKSGTCTIKYAVQLGFSIFEHESKDTIRQINDIRKELRHSNNPLIPSYLFLLKINIGKVNNPIKRNIIQNKNIISAIKKNSDSLNISLNSFIQILLSYALSTTGNSNSKIREIKNIAREEKIQFRETINNTLDILIRLISGEKEDEIELEES